MISKFVYNKQEMNEKPRLLLIDDDKSLLLGLAETIKRDGTYQVVTADNGNLGIQLAKENPPHLIVCDLMMPPPDGWAVLKALSEHAATALIPFIFLTARTGDHDKVKGMNLGADDYITKPFSKDELLARVNAILRRQNITQGLERVKSQQEISALSSKVYELLQKFSTDQDGLAEAMAQMLALRDNETEEHARRVVDLSVKLARRLGMEESLIHHIHLGALLHDIGKVGIPDSILLKPGTLTNEERKIMSQHPLIGKRILQSLGLPPTVLHLVQYHHERWDGSGYPERLVGEKIPLPARIFAIVDVWDALTSDRPYREAWPQEKVISHLKTQSGKHFDPNLVGKFLDIIQDEDKK
jgi:putative two-component system response regulator